MGKPLGVFPFLRYFPPYRQKYLEVYNGFKDLRNFILESVLQHEQTLDSSNPRDFIDMYLIEAAETKNPIFTRDNLIAVCVDLFLGGSETTSKVNL